MNDFNKLVDELTDPKKWKAILYFGFFLVTLMLSLGDLGAWVNWQRRDDSMIWVVLIAIIWSCIHTWVFWKLISEDTSLNISFIAYVIPCTIFSLAISIELRHSGESMITVPSYCCSWMIIRWIFSTIPDEN